MSRSEGTSPQSFKDKVHGLLRESILNAAWGRARHASWSQVRIADIAQDVGVSRQTIYNEFGTKEDLSLALFNRELERFLAELETQVAAAERFEDGIRAALHWMIDQVTDHELLARMVSDARSGVGEGLVPILTVRSDMIIKPVRATLSRMALERWPEVDPAAAEVVSDIYVRFILSQIITPTDLDRDVMIDAMLALALNIRPPSKDR